MERKLKYIDEQKIEEDIAAGHTAPDDGAPPEDVLYETLLDLIQISENEGFTEDEVDGVLRRILDYRAQQKRTRFRLHTGDVD